MSEAHLEGRLKGIIAAWALLLAANNMLPYLGLRDDSCQTMFSSLSWGEHWNNHYFVPQRMTSDIWAYLEISDVTIAPTPARDTRLRWIAEWLNAPRRLRNTESVRVAVDQLCRAEHRVALTTRRSDRPDDPFTRYDDACAAPELAPHRWIPVRLHETDFAWSPEDSP